MNQDFVLKTLSTVMNWETDRARLEFAWLRLMSRIKYDGYQDFLAGMRFIESLADWLQQFSIDERECAYQFVRQELVYVGSLEMAHLVELFYPETVEWRLMQETASRLRIKPYQIWATNEATKLFQSLLRRTLFIELSDGARIDIFRRANAGVISNEQIVTAPRIIRPKWDDLLKDLRADLSDDKATFAFIFLVDDFVGSGTTLLRQVNENWTGKMVRFWEDLEEAGVINSHLATDWEICVHHYIASHLATEAVRDRQKLAIEARKKAGAGWFDRVQFSYGMILPADFPINEDRCKEFLRLVEKYYDDSIETKHVKLGGDDARLGFGHCALPLVLEHNTPNNSVALLWAETDGGDSKHAMRPLFRRRQRHL